MVTSWNRAATKIYGYGDGEMIGSYVDKLVPPEDAKAPVALLDTIKRRDQIEHLETIGQRKDGSKVRVSLSLSPMKNPNGEITGASGIARELPMELEETEAAETKASTNMENQNDVAPLTADADDPADGGTVAI